MRKNLIKKLAEESFVKNTLDKNKTAKIAKSLKREDLKVYIKDLKTISARNSVTVTLPSDQGLRDMKNYFFKIYPHKRILFNIDETMLTGIRVVDYDNVYELSLKSFLENSLRGTTND